MDPQIVVGMLVTGDGFPSEIQEFTGNTAETLTVLPVLRAFQDRHAVDDVVVVADAGMLSAGNLNAIEDAGSRSSSGPGSARPATTSPNTSTGTVVSSTTGSPWNRNGSWALARTRANAV